MKPVSDNIREKFYYKIRSKLYMNRPIDEVVIDKMYLEMENRIQGVIPLIQTKQPLRDYYHHKKEYERLKKELKL